MTGNVEIDSILMKYRRDKGAAGVGAGVIGRPTISEKLAGSGQGKPEGSLKEGMESPARGQVQGKFNKTLEADIKLKTIEDHFQKNM